MKGKTAQLRTCLKIAAAILLLVGLGSAAAIYLTAGEATDAMPGYEPEDSKLYQRNLELYGGKANVLATEFSRRFDGLWHGRSLAGTVASITIAVSAAMFFVARTLTSDPHSDKRGE